ncbi:MAG: recombination regulator RecX [Micrococcales bacterium]|nr:recombination regulator RecX [Micrococcales bacterium]
MSRTQGGAPVGADADQPDQPERAARGKGRARRTARRAASGGAPPPDPEAQDPEPDAEDVARRIVLRQLTGSPKSRAQLEEALRKRNCPDDVASRVLDRMSEVGLVDDEAYAAMLVRSKQSSRGLARRALRQELRTKGVDDATADAVLADVPDADEEERARELVAKRLRSMHGLDATVQTRRLAGMLARKGYPPGLAMRVVREAVAEAPEHRRD